MAISGAARFTAHGSAAAVLGAALGGGAGSAVAGAGAAVGVRRLRCLGDGRVARRRTRPAGDAAAAAALPDVAGRHRTPFHSCAPYRHLARRPGRRRGGSRRCRPLDWHLDDVARYRRARGATHLRRPADSPRGAAGRGRRRLRDAVGHPGRDHPGDDGGLRRRRPRADRHRQDGGVRDPDPVEDRHVEPHHPGAGAGADARTRAAGRRGVQPLRRASAA